MLCSINISLEKSVNKEEHITLYSEASIGICDRLSLEVHKNTFYVFYVFTPSLKCVTFVAISHPKSPLVASASIQFVFTNMWDVGADLVLDLKLAEDWTILELQREMVTRYNQRSPGSR